MTATEKHRPRQRTPPKKTFAAKLCDTLGERAPGARNAIIRAEMMLGEAAMKRLAAATLRLIEEGGLPTLDNTRQRTPGGILLRLIKECLTEDQRRQLWRYGWRVETYQSAETLRIAVQAEAEQHNRKR